MVVKYKLLEKKYKSVSLKFLERMNKKYKIVCMLVTGSYYTKKLTKKSDLDLFILGKHKDLGDLEEKNKIKINPIKAKEFNEKEHLIKEIIKNHVVLKGVEEFTNILWQI